jgi:hypothetical protein
MNEVNPYESPQESDESIGNARSPLWLPAWGILTLSLLMLLANLLFWSLDGAIRNDDYEQEAERYQDILLILWTSLTAMFGIVGSIAMLRMKNRRLVVATAILACVPYIGIAGGCLTAAFGLIALMRLRRKEVWDAFQS